MRKDYVPVTAANAGTDEISFVENFWSQRWDHVAQLPRTEAVSRSAEYRLIKPFLRRLPSGSRILDGGCGLGVWTVFLANEGFDVVGLDISQRTIARLKELFPNYQFLCGDIRHTKFENASFDGYFSWGTFEHFEKGLGECLGEAYRILRPDGLLFVSVPFQSWRHILRDSRALQKWDHTYDPRIGYRQAQRFYQWRLTRSELQRELELHGFRVHSVTPIHKFEGVGRLMHWEMRWPHSRTLLYRGIQYLLSLMLPASYVSHMILVVAERRREA